MKALLAIVAAILVGVCIARDYLSLCPVHGDSHGTWNVTSTVNLRNARRFFVDGFYGEAVQFSRMWFPHNCSYHRFTNTSLQAVASHLIASGKSKSKHGNLQLMFMGDSALRGIVCGIVRILSGSEMFGPNNNTICGYTGILPHSFETLNQQFDVNFGNITLSYTYIKTMETAGTLQSLEASLFQNPYSLVFNTGAWSFWGIPIRPSPPGNWRLGDDCTTPPQVKASSGRIQQASQDAYAQAGKLGHQLGVKMIYRTNHFNIRYGVNCADGALIPILQKRQWEIWDNTRLSMDTWRQQTHDGFHFDRTIIHTEEEHVRHIQEALQKNHEIPGMLEMQLTHSLLHYLFRDTLQELLTNNITIPKF